MLHPEFQYIQEILDAMKSFYGSGAKNLNLKYSSPSIPLSLHSNFSVDSIFIKPDFIIVSLIERELDVKPFVIAQEVVLTPISNVPIVSFLANDPIGTEPIRNYIERNSISWPIKFKET